MQVQAVSRSSSKENLKTSKPINYHRVPKKCRMEPRSWLKLLTLSLLFATAQGTATCKPGQQLELPNRLQNDVTPIHPVCWLNESAFTQTEETVPPPQSNRFSIFAPSRFTMIFVTVSGLLGYGAHRAINYFEDTHESEMPPWLANTFALYQAEPVPLPPPPFAPLVPEPQQQIPTQRNQLGAG